MRINFQLRNVSAGTGIYAGIPQVYNGSFLINHHHLVWCAITCGKDSLYTLNRNGFESLMEMTYRTTILFANLSMRNLNWHQGLMKSNVFRSLDPTEKGGVSYYIGNVTAKLFSEQIYSVDWLMHVDVYAAGRGFQIPPGQRPDFFGLDTLRQLHVVESKGTGGPFSRAVHNGALLQAKGNFVYAGNIASRNASQAYFHNRTGELEAVFEDPDGEGEVIEINVNAEGVVEMYYMDIYKCCRDFGFEYGDQVRFELENGIQIGLKKWIYDAYEDGRFGYIAEQYFLSSPQFEFNETEDSTEYVGRDGVIAQCPLRLIADI